MEYELLSRPSERTDDFEGRPVFRSRLSMRIVGSNSHAGPSRRHDDLIPSS
jgi:hypothetical protein